MTDNDLDRILSAQPTIQPSARFLSDVLAAVDRAAVEPPRPAFPWGRFALGATALSVMAAAATSLATQFGASLGATIDPLMAVAPELSYAIAAVLVGLGTATVPRILSRS